MITDQQKKVARWFSSGEPGAKPGYYGADPVEAMKRVRYQPTLGGFGVYAKSAPDGFDTRDEAVQFAEKTKAETIRWMAENNIK